MSAWKGPYIHNSLLKKNTNKVWNKSTVIIPKLINNTLYVYNGRKLIKVKINANMIGYKLGSFIVAKKRMVYKKK